MGARIYLVEDEENLNILLKTYLEREGHLVTGFLAGLPALNKIEDLPDLWILDIMLPDIDGYLLIKRIKAHCATTPVIFMSAKNDQLDRVVGLELGGDDYLPKPFLPRELVIRVQLLLDKRQSAMVVPQGLADVALGKYEVSFPKRVVVCEDQEINLTHKEWQLLRYLVDNLGLVVSREQILYGVWGDNYFGSDRVVDDTIRRLRKKMPDLALETLYHAGYKLVNSK